MFFIHLTCYIMENGSGFVNDGICSYSKRNQNGTSLKNHAKEKENTKSINVNNHEIIIASKPKIRI